ncbi:metalloendopeptidase [Leptolyngbya sp. 'hensonii']|uniref:DUF3352 domain-containing protein n=1 Tax=Leptolyngbya sp. 'hensonii' TaxID=1922337 RepID=UPI0009500DAA|nr:DUF3352 domain-containing protein [Leptolyngbya sp. 'hensonii']OLP15509.1 metalloendopeptidase [Leptolyngbya sp. 'hensonii']
MSASKTKFLLPAIGAAVVVAAGVGAYVYFKQGPAGETSPLASAKLVPDEAVMTAFISADPKSWAELEKFGTLEAQKLVQKNIKDFQTEMLNQTSFSFENDIQPWLGSVMFAFLPNDPAAKANNPNVLMVVSIRDKLKAANFAQKIKAQKGATAKEQSYKGVTIAEVTESKGSKPYNFALLGSHLVVSDQRQAIEQAIDTFKGEPSFAGKEGVKDLLVKGADVKNPIAQIYLPDYAAAFQQFAAAGSKAPKLPSSTLSQLKQVKSAVIGIGVDDAGLRLRAIARLNPEATPMEYKPVPGKVVAQFPADSTIALIGGQGLKTVWTTLINQSKTDPSSGLVVSSVRQQLKTINLDADQEVFGWMDGEFAFGAIASTQGLLSNTGFGGAMVIQTNDRKTAESTLGKLDTLVKGFAATVEQRDVAGKKVTEWKIPTLSPTEALIAHGWLDDKSLFIAIGGPLVDVIASKPQSALDGSATYKTVTGPLPKPNSAYLYLDMDKMMALMTAGPLKAQTGTIPPDTMAILTSIQGVGMASTQPDKLTSQFEMLMALKPRK